MLSNPVWWAISSLGQYNEVNGRRVTTSGCTSPACAIIHTLVGYSRRLLTFVHYYPKACSLKSQRCPYGAFKILLHIQILLIISNKQSLHVG